VVEHDTLYVAVSQSGETYDTLAAVQELRRKGGRVLGVVNAVGSAIARECDGGVYLHAGPEVSVASTKAFTSTAVVLALIALHLGRIHDLSPANGRRIADGLRALPGQIEEILAQEDKIAALAKEYSRYPGMFFIGRVRGFPAAREGAQKLKEISYLHAEGVTGGELKHGPIALLHKDFPVIAICTASSTREKMVSNVHEIVARDTPVLALVTAGDHSLDGVATDVFEMPEAEEAMSAILNTVMLQLFAYHVAVKLGQDVDQPRNLAKSVTVE
jgi:glucosamine--fructose-6-phosphate aminotransferase (isomerizing)